MVCAIAGISLPAFAQDTESVPPAFERAGSSSKKTDGHDIFDPDADAPKLIRVQVEFIGLYQEDFTKLLFLQSPQSSDATDLRKQVQDMISNNKANLIETQIVTSRSGEKSTSESVHEYIYPTEYEPASLGLKTEKALEKAMASSFPSNPATPTAFETRNLGSTLQVEPTLGSDNRLIDLRLVPEVVWHTGDTKWGETKDAHGSINTITMPDFYTLRVNTAVTCIAGQYTFVSALSPKDDMGNSDMTRKVMVFVKCDVLAVK